MHVISHILKKEHKKPKGAENYPIVHQPWDATQSSLRDMRRSCSPFVSACSGALVLRSVLGQVSLKESKSYLIGYYLVCLAYVEQGLTKLSLNI